MPFFAGRLASESFQTSDLAGSDGEITTFDEPEEHFKTREQATEAACNFVKKGGANLADTSQMTYASRTLGPYKGKIVGIEQATGAPINFRVRCDWDDKKGYHFNAEYGKGTDRKKTAFIVDGHDKKAYETHMKWLTKQNPERTAVEIKRLWTSEKGLADSE